MIAARKVGWHPGDLRHAAGFVACALLDDGTLVLPHGHPATFETELEAAALLDRIEDGPDGPRIRPRLTLIQGGGEG